MGSLFTGYYASYELQSLLTMAYMAASCPSRYSHIIRERVLNEQLEIQGGRSIADLYRRGLKNCANCGPIFLIYLRYQIILYTSNKPQNDFGIYLGRPSTTKPRRWECSGMI